MMTGDVHVDEVERALNIDLPRGSYETIAGLVIDEFGGLPEEGASLQIRLPDDPGDLAQAEDPEPRYLDVEVLAIERHVPSRLRLVLPDELVTKPPEPADDEPHEAHETYESDEPDESDASPTAPDATDDTTDRSTAKTPKDRS